MCIELIYKFLSSKLLLRSFLNQVERVVSREHFDSISLLLLIKKVCIIQAKVIVLQFKFVDCFK